MRNYIQQSDYRGNTSHWEKVGLLLRQVYHAPLPENIKASFFFSKFIIRNNKFVCLQDIIHYYFKNNYISAR